MFFDGKTKGLLGFIFVLMLALWVYAVATAWTDMDGNMRHVFEPMTLFLLSMLFLLLLRYSDTKGLKMLLVILALTALIDVVFHVVTGDVSVTADLMIYVAYGMLLLAIGLCSVREMIEQRKKETFAKALSIFNETIFLQCQPAKNKIHLRFSRKFIDKYGVDVKDIHTDLDGFTQFLTHDDRLRFDEMNEKDLMQPSFNIMFDAKFPGMDEHIPMLGQNTVIDHRSAFAVLIDMSDIQKLQDDLAGMREAYHFSHEENLKIFANTKEIIAKYDKDGHVVFATDSFARIYDEEPEAIIGASVHDLNRSIGHEDTVWFDNVLRDGRGTSLETLYHIDDEPCWIRWSNEVIKDAEGNPTYVMAIGHDVTALKNLNERLEDETIHDKETDLLNRAGFIETLNERTDDSPMTVYFLDIGNFSDIRDYYGLSMTKRFSRAFAASLSALESHGIIIGRHGNDEYMVAVPLDDIHAHEAFKHLTYRFIHEVLNVDDTPINMTINLGYAIYPDDDDDPAMVIGHANIAMAEAKKQRLNRPLKFEPAMLDQLQNRFVMIAKLKKAMRANLFESVFQPVIDVDRGTVVSYEALSRWHDDDLGAISPGVFLDLAEKSRLIAELDRLLIKNAIHAFAACDKKQCEDATLSINVFKDVFLSDGLFAFLGHELEENGLHPQDIVLELNETIFISDLDAIIARIREAQDRGYQIAIDDFGKHYSSLSVLTKIPFDIIKVDRLFVDQIDDPTNREVVRMVLRLARSTGRAVIAEGVETDEQADALKTIGCLLHQGFHYGRPGRIQ